MIAWRTSAYPEVASLSLSGDLDPLTLRSNYETRCSVSFELGLDLRPRLP